jgi:hypothetical protein
MTGGIPLRGAVGYGPAFISIDPIFFTGCELSKTMKLERKQAWAGAILDESAVKTLNSGQVEPFFLEYPVPMYSKNSDAVTQENRLAIDWVTCLSENPGNSPPWELMFQSKDSRVLKKGEETQKFFDQLLSSQPRRNFPICFNEADVTELRKLFSHIISTA